jgi:signal transduction histidine kinase
MFGVRSPGGGCAVASSPVQVGEDSVLRNGSVAIRKRVLILYTHRQFSPINTQWHSGIVESVKRGYDGPVDFEVEYIDPVLQTEKDFLNAWSSLLQARYGKSQPDVIMPVYFPAFTFLIANRAAFFPDCPIVFCAVPTGFAKSQAAHAHVTGVGIPLHFGESLEATRQVIPGLKKVVILSGTSSLDDWMRRVAFRYHQEHFEGVELVDLQGAPVEHARRYLSGLEKGSAVMMLSFEADRQGNRYTTEEYLESVADASTVPIFSFSDTLLGHGTIGGTMSSPLEQGVIAGRMVARILRGESADSIPEAFDLETRSVFDAQVMDRYGIKESQLPEGARVINRKPTVWSQYGKYLAVGLAAILLQSAIIVSLLVNRVRRIRAENESRSLAGRILTAIEDERRYLARELHDDVSQRLAAVTIETGTLENRMQGDTVSELKDWRGSLGKVKKHLIGICDDLHRLSHRMHPAVLDDFGLPDALRTECKELSDRSGIPVEYIGPASIEEIPKEVSLCLYRIAQEALWNAAKYSASDRIFVQLTSDSEFIYLEIRDNGVGFDPGAEELRKGLGLASMRERVRLVEGTIKIETSPGNGVVIAVIIPVPEHSLVRSMESATPRPMLMKVDKADNDRFSREMQRGKK